MFYDENMFMIVIWHKNRWTKFDDEMSLFLGPHSIRNFLEIVNASEKVLILNILAWKLLHSSKLTVESLHRVGLFFRSYAKVIMEGKQRKNNFLFCMAESKK